MTRTRRQLRFHFGDSTWPWISRKLQVRSLHALTHVTLTHVIAGGERWYVNQVQLAYSTNNPIFEHIDRPNLNVKLSTPPHTYLFPTPIGKSFECMQEKTTVMYSQVIWPAANYTQVIHAVIVAVLVAGWEWPLRSFSENILPRNSGPRIHVQSRWTVGWVWVVTCTLSLFVTKLWFDGFSVDLPDKLDVISWNLEFSRSHILGHFISPECIIKKSFRCVTTPPSPIRNQIAIPGLARKQ